MSTDDSLIQNTNHTHPFKLCNQLNLAGCGVNTLPDFVRNYVNNEIQTAGYNYSLPLDPCDFDTINMSWILSISDLSLLDLITADQVLSIMPCEIYIQMPSEFLSDRNIAEALTHSYWFGSNGHCQYNESRVLDCADANRTILNYTTPVHMEECFYPFAPSKYETPIQELVDAGFTNCGLSCDFYPYGGDIQNLDVFNFAASMIALVFGVAYFMNVLLALKQKKSKRLCELSLSFDIPIMIALWVLILTIILVIPSIFGKDYFACEEGSNAVVADPLYETNMHCFISGQVLLVAVHSIYLYCSLLSFSIWRSLARPTEPLFGVHKIWFHVAVYVVIFGFHISALSEEAFGGNNVIGTCGINIVGDVGMRFVLAPLMFDLSTFIIFTLLTLYELRKHFRNQIKHNQAKKTQKAIAHLTIRMMVYSFFVAVSMCCWLYIAVEMVFGGDEWRVHVSDHIGCLVDNELFGSNEECELILTISDSIYWMQGIVILLVSVASFVLSCTNARYNDYGKMKESAVSQLQKVTTLTKPHHIAAPSGLSVGLSATTQDTTLPCGIPMTQNLSTMETVTRPSMTISAVPNN